MSKPIILCGEAQGRHEASINRGFVGASGVELLRMLDDAGFLELTSADHELISEFYRTGDPWQTNKIWLRHPEFHRTNVFQLHPPGDKIEALCGPKYEAIPGYPALIKGKHIRREFSLELERLRDEIADLDPNLIICLGNSALWALAGKTGVSKLRGTTELSTHTVTGFKLLSTYHPAAVLRQWELRPTVVVDLAKAKRESEYPEVRRPKREIWIEPSLPDIERFRDEHIHGCRILSTDIETSGTRITCIGFSPRPDLAIVIPFDDERKKDGNYWSSQELEQRVWKIVRGILEDRSVPKLFQNGLYDIAFLLRAYGIGVRGAEHDTLLLHHALQPESLKSLGFLGSIYTDEGAWKAQRKMTTTIKRDE